MYINYLGRYQPRKTREIISRSLIASVKTRPSGTPHRVGV